MSWTEEQLAAHYAALKTPTGCSGVCCPAGKVPPMREALIEAECTRLLEQDGWRALRTDPVSDRGKGKGFGELGMADALMLRPIKPAYPLGPQCCEVLWIEFKCGKNRAKSHQIEWHRNERARGFMTWIANEDFPATVNGFREHYAQSGLMRRSDLW